MSVHYAVVLAAGAVLSSSVFAQGAARLPNAGASSGYIRIGDADSLEPQQLTIDLTFVPMGVGTGNSNDANGATLIAKPREGAGGVYIFSWAMQWSPTARSINAHLSNNGTSVGAAVRAGCSLALGSTARATMTFDGATLRLYINGRLAAEEATGFSSVWYGTDDVLIGAGNYCCGFTRRFDGVIDDVSLWDRALSAQEVADLDGSALGGDEANLIGLWQFDDGTYDDATGNGNHGAAVGSASLTDDLGNAAPCAADVDGDACLSTNDFFAYLTAYQAQDSAADFSPPGGDGLINTNDFFAFLAAYQAGC